MITFTRINNDINGNPRYVCHFLTFTTNTEREQFHKIHGLNATSELYKLAVKRANTIGGRKYHTKKYGGGIVFQSYSITETEKYITELMSKIA